MTNAEFIKRWATSPRKCRHKPLSGTEEALRSYGTVIVEVWPGENLKFLVAEYEGSQTTRTHINRFTQSVEGDQWIEVPYSLGGVSTTAQKVLGILELRCASLQTSYTESRYYNQRNRLQRDIQDMKDQGRNTAQFFKVPVPQWAT